MNERKELLNRAIDAARSDTPGPAAESAAVDRVWSRLNAAPDVHHIRNCDDVCQLKRAYQSNELPEARRLLIADHLKECAACRGFYAGSVRPISAWSAPARPSAGFRVSPRWAMAAAVTLAVGIASPWLWNRLNAPVGDSLAVQSIDGMLVRVAADGEQTLRTGDTLTGGAVIRTASASHAFVRLTDGSVIEMADRAQLSVTRGRQDMTIHLDRGNIIVQAAKRRTGHLYVQAPDCRVAVTGTTFAVNRGVKGSRVSVVEGEVHVAQAGQDKVLHSGDQAVTTAYLQRTPVRDEIAWSSNADQHLALLAQFQTLQARFEQIRLPNLRYQSTLLPLLPANTVFFVSLPNLGDAVGQAQQIFDEQLQQSAVLRDWWKQSPASSHLPEVLQQMRNVSQFLGDEIVVAAAPGAKGHPGAPVFLARQARPGLADYLKANHFPAELPVIIKDDLVIVAPGGPADTVALTSGLATTPFGQRLLQAYQDGAGILFAADMSALTELHKEANQITIFSTSTRNVRYLVVERKDNHGVPQNRADLSFDGERRGIFSWLGKPGPMGAMQFVSPEASIVTAAIVKSPAAMLTDLLEGQSADSAQQVSVFEKELSLRLREDLAQPLGTEILFSIDGPLLPTPSWKLVAEVNDSSRLQHTIQTLVDRYNDQARLNQRPAATLQSGQVNNRMYYTLTTAQPGVPEIHYTYTDGYLIAGPSSALVTKALSIRDSGTTFARTDRFASLLPPDSQTNFSALVYHNLGPLASPILSQLQGNAALSPQQQETMKSLAANAKPSLLYAYATPDRIQVSSARDFFGLDLKSMLFGGIVSNSQANKQPHTNKRELHSVH